MTSPVRVPQSTPRPTRDLRSAPQRRPVRHLEVVPAPVRRRRSGAVVVLAALVVFASLLAAALVHSQVVSAQANLDRIDRQIGVERDQLAQERLALADRQSPKRIAEAAVARGMVLAPRQHWVSNDGRTAVVTGQVAPGPGPGATAGTTPDTTADPTTTTAPVPGSPEATPPAPGGARQ
ncbi:MAG: hypothetical protein ACR2MB_02330 [Acidimicrobiales bacterium]